MKSYKIVIEIEDFEGVYSQVDSLKTAQEIAGKKCNDIYNRLNGKCSVSVKSVEELSQFYLQMNFG
jgi:hypothetical protein